MGRLFPSRRLDELLWVRRSRRAPAGAAAGAAMGFFILLMCFFIGFFFIGLAGTLVFSATRALSR